MNKRVFKWTGKCMDEFFMIIYAHSFSNLERGVFIYYILTIMKYVKEKMTQNNITWHTCLRIALTIYAFKNGICIPYFHILTNKY